MITRVLLSVLSSEFSRNPLPKYKGPINIFYFSIKKNHFKYKQKKNVFKFIILMTY